MESTDTLSAREEYWAAYYNAEKADRLFEVASHKYYRLKSKASKEKYWDTTLKALLEAERAAQDTLIAAKSKWDAEQ